MILLLKGTLLRIIGLILLPLVAIPQSYMPALAILVLPISLIGYGSHLVNKADQKQQKEEKEMVEQPLLTDEQVNYYLKIAYGKE